MSMYEGEAYMSLGKKLRHLRTEKNLTQKQLAKKVDVSLKTISRYEVGETKPRYRKTYDKIAGVLDSTYDYLVADEEEFILNEKSSTAQQVQGMQKRWFKELSV